jgi:thiosulfate reductase cytochrome b subunit
MIRLWLHPLPLRLWHWANTVIVLFLIITGIQLRAPDIAILPSYRSAVLAHKGTGFIMALFFLFWIIYTVLNRQSRRQYRFRFTDLVGLARQSSYYAFGVFRGQINPYPAKMEAKFNPLQKASYLFIQCIFTPLIITTGILFSDILFFSTAINSIGGIKVIDLIHVIVAYIFVLYLLVHIYMSTMGHTPFTHIKAMFTGYEEEGK